MSAPDDYLEQFPAGSSDREYQAALCTVVAGMSFDDSDSLVGLGLLSFLDSYDFVGAGIDTTKHPAVGSLYSDAEFVAHVFRKVGRDASWWRDNYLRGKDAAAVSQQAEFWCV